MSTGGEGCTRSTWVLMEMVDIWDTTVASCARASVSFFAERAAGMSKGGASVRPEIATEAALAWVGRLWRYSVLCGRTGKVVGRLARLGMYMRSLKT